VAHFYLSDEVANTSVGQTVVVTGTEARHAITVGRLAVGEQLRVGDGQGFIADGQVTAVGRDTFDLHVTSTQVEESPRQKVWLAQALAKGDRDELAIQAATELGVDGVIPWAATRSIVKWEGAKVAKHQKRWASIVREATKQSVRSRIPLLRPLCSSAELAALGQKFHLVVLDPSASISLSSLASDGRDIVLVVGPEGGIAPAELTRFVEAGASRVALGSGILRTSTAGPAAIAVLNVSLGRW